MDSPYDDDHSQVTFVFPDEVELEPEDDEEEIELGSGSQEPQGAMDATPEIFDNVDLNLGHSPVTGLTEEVAPILLLDENCKIDIDLGDISRISLDRRSRTRVEYSGPVLLTDRASHKSFKATSRDLHREGVGLAFSGEPPKVGDQMILEFVGDSKLEPFSLQAVVTSVEKKSEAKFTFVGLKVTYAGSLAKRRIENFVAKSSS